MTMLPDVRPLKFLVFAGSLRADSLNAKLAQLAARTLQANGGEVDLARFRDFDSPSYDADAQDGTGFPAAAEEFRRRLEASDGLVISAPEYNTSMPGSLKNLIDWTSRFQPQPFKQHHALLMSASPSMAGGNRGLWSLRIPLEHLGAHVFPDMFSLAQAHQAFDASGDIADPQLRDRFRGTIKAFADLTEAARRYPCVRQWAEFLGEHTTDATTARTS